MSGRRTVVEAVDAVDRRALVVAAQHEEVLRVAHLVAQQQDDHLDALLPSIDVIAEEKVVGLRRVPAKLEEAQQVGVLPGDAAGHVRAQAQRRSGARLCWG